MMTSSGKSVLLPRLSALIECCASHTKAEVKVSNDDFEHVGIVVMPSQILEKGLGILVPRILHPPPRRSAKPSNYHHNTEQCLYGEINVGNGHINLTKDGKEEKPAQLNRFLVPQIHQRGIKWSSTLPFA